MDFLLTCRRCEHWEAIPNYHDLRYHLRVVHGIRQLANSDLCLYATHPNTDPDVLRYGPVETRQPAFTDARQSISTNRGSLVSYGDLSDADPAITNERISEMVAQGIERGIASVLARKRSDPDRESRRPIQPPSIGQRLVPTRVIRNDDATVSASGKRKASEVVLTDSKKARKSAPDESECSHQSMVKEEMTNMAPKSTQSDDFDSRSTDVDEEIRKLEERAKALKDLDLPVLTDVTFKPEQPVEATSDPIAENEISSDSISKQIVENPKKSLVEKDTENSGNVGDTIKNPILEKLSVEEEIVNDAIAKSNATIEEPGISCASKIVEENPAVCDEHVQTTGSTSGAPVNKKKKQKPKDQKEQLTVNAGETDAASTPKTRSEHRRARK